MITLTILSGVLTSSLALWLLVLRVDPRYRLYLAVFIPLAFAWPFAVYQYGGSLLGYSIAARIPADFRLVFAYADDKIHTVYALIVEPGASVPSSTPSPIITSRTKNSSLKRRPPRAGHSRIGNTEEGCKTR